MDSFFAVADNLDSLLDEFEENEMHQSKATASISGTSAPVETSAASTTTVDKASARPTVVAFSSEKYSAPTDIPTTQLNGSTEISSSHSDVVDQNGAQQTNIDEPSAMSSKPVLENENTKNLDDGENILNFEISPQYTEMTNPAEPVVLNQTNSDLIMDIFGAAPAAPVDVGNEPLPLTALSPFNPFSASYIGSEEPLDSHGIKSETDVPEHVVPFELNNPFLNQNTEEQKNGDSLESTMKYETVNEDSFAEPVATHTHENMQFSNMLADSLLPSASASASVLEEQPSGLPEDGLPDTANKSMESEPFNVIDPFPNSNADHSQLETGSSHPVTASIDLVTDMNDVSKISNVAMSPPSEEYDQSMQSTVAGKVPTMETVNATPVSERQETSSIGFMRDVEISKEEFDRFLEEMEDYDTGVGKTEGSIINKTEPSEHVAASQQQVEASETSLMNLSEMTITGSTVTISNPMNPASHTGNNVPSSSNASSLPASGSPSFIREDAAQPHRNEVVSSPVAVPYVPSPGPDPEGSPTFPLVRKATKVVSQNIDQSEDSSQQVQPTVDDNRLSLNVNDRAEEVVEVQNNYPETPPPPYSEEMHASYERSLTPLVGSATGQHLSMQNQYEHDQSGSHDNQAEDGDVSLLPSSILDSITRPGETRPNWVPDQDAPQCSNCAQKFTFTRRRHHCRACGRVFCAQCCSEKSQLKYMEYKEARVCLMCSLAIKQADALAEQIARRAALISRRAAQNSASAAQVPEQVAPIEVAEFAQPEQPVQTHQQPETEQANIPAPQPQPQGQSNDAAPPAQEDLEVEGAMAGATTAKSVRFSDGTRPKHPDEVPTTPPPPTRTNRLRKRHVGAIEPANFDSTTLPPVVIAHGENGTFAVQENPDFNVILSLLESGDQNPQTFVLSPNLAVHVKFVSHCSRQCWCFWSEGMDCVGQREIALILERQGLGDRQISRNVFTFYKHIFDRARKGKIYNTADFMPKTVMGLEDDGELFGLERNAGFLFVQTTSQSLDGLSCLKKRVLRCSGIYNNSQSKQCDTPIEGMLFALLVQKPEAPWATLFPLRLMLRLGAEVKQYPCPLFSIRQRDPVYQELGHTILAILCDFHNFKYKVISVPGLRAVLSANGNISVQIPCNRFTDTIRIMNSSNESVLAIGAGTYGPKIPAHNEVFTSADAPCDSHLVCIQDQENNVYHTEIVSMKNTKAINTGAAFVIFNGSLKSDGNHLAKCAIVEDGIMIQLLPEKMDELRGCLKSMEDFTVPLGINSQNPPESTNADAAPGEQSMLEVKWVENDTFFNIGMFSPIDGTAFKGIVGFNVQGRSEQKGRRHILRWNQVFFLASTSNPLDLSRLAEQVANGCFLAFTPVIHELVKHGIHKVGVRVTIHPENVGYIAGSGQRDLPPVCMNALDEHLIQTIHNAASSVAVEQEAVVFELLFSVLLTKPPYRTA